MQIIVWMLDGRQVKKETTLFDFIGMYANNLYQFHIIACHHEVQLSENC